MRRTAVFKLGTVAALFILAVMLIACESSDPTAVQGSQIILTAQPNPVDLNLNPAGDSLITARVLTGNGTPQQDTIVFFSTSNGTVNPTEDTTDDEGRAFTTFSSNVATTATVTAQSGSATASQQIQVL
ncbi:MAG: Ig-like domain-containing protein, partial [Acidobacteriota bacterium]